jgi:hypothetical protein
MLNAVEATIISGQERQFRARHHHITERKAS